MPSLDVLCAGVMLIALTFYALLAGADFGGGVWDLLARGPRAEQQRNLISEAIGPIWEANHVWLILVVVVLFTAFPPAFAAIMTALHIPLTVMLIGIVLRGAAFTFRTYDSERDAVQRRWGQVFAISSVFTPVMLGICIGAVASGRITVVDNVVTSGFVSAWLTPFPWVVGGLALTLFAFLAAVYLTVEARDAELRDDFRTRALLAAVAVGVMALLVFVFSGSGAPRIRDGLITSIWSWPLQIGTGVAAVGALWALWTRRFSLARMFAAAQVTLILWGWGAAQFPYLVEPDITIQGAAAPQITLRLLLIALGRWRGGAVSVGVHLVSDLQRPRSVQDRGGSGGGERVAYAVNWACRILRFFIVMTGAFMLIVTALRRTILLFAALLILGGAAERARAADAIPTQLSGPSISQALISPDSKHVVFVRDNELYSVAAAGVAPVRLSQTFGAGGAVYSSFVYISPDSRRVVFLARQTESAPIMLYSVPIAGGSPVQLNAPLASGNAVDLLQIQVSGDSTYVSYRINNAASIPQELWSARIDGSAATQLAATQSNQRLGFVVISPDGQHIAYQVIDGFQTPGEQLSIYTVATAGGAPAQIEGAFSSFNYNADFDFSPDSAFVVYHHRSSPSNLNELFAAPAGGGTARKLDSPAGYDLARSFLISADSKYVVFVATDPNSNTANIYSTPLAPAGLAIELGTQVGTSAGILFRITPDAKTVVYKEFFQTMPGGSFQTNLRSVPITGGPIARLNPVDSEVDSFFYISPDSQRVVYFIESTNSGIYSSPVAGNVSAVKINATLSGQAYLSDRDITITPDSRSVLYRAAQGQRDFSLYITSIVQQTARKLNGTIAKVGDSNTNDSDSVNFRVSSDGTYLVFRGAPAQYDPPYSLYRVGLPTRPIFVPVVAR